MQHCWKLSANGRSCHYGIVRRQYRLRSWTATGGGDGGNVGVLHPSPLPLPIPPSPLPPSPLENRGNFFAIGGAFLATCFSCWGIFSLCGGFFVTFFFLWRTFLHVGGGVAIFVLMGVGEGAFRAYPPPYENFCGRPNIVLILHSDYLSILQTFHKLTTILYISIKRPHF